MEYKGLNISPERDPNRWKFRPSWRPFAPFKRKHVSNPWPGTDKAIRLIYTPFRAVTSWNFWMHSQNQEISEPCRSYPRPSRYPKMFLTPQPKRIIFRFFWKNINSEYVCFLEPGSNDHENLRNRSRNNLHERFMPLNILKNHCPCIEDDRHTVYWKQSTFKRSLHSYTIRFRRVSSFIKLHNLAIVLVNNWYPIRREFIRESS